MNNLLGNTIFWLLLILATFVIIKTCLYFAIEKQWDPKGFFHYSTIDLKLTNRKGLKKWRKRQNALSRIILLVGSALLFLTIFYILIKPN